MSYFIVSLRQLCIPKIESADMLCMVNGRKERNKSKFVVNKYECRVNNIEGVVVENERA